MKTDSSTLKIHEIRRIFQRHYGAQSELARQLDLSRKAISSWLKGRIVSARIAEAAQQMAVSLAEKETADVV